jgi:hypothetical protein
MNSRPLASCSGPTTRRACLRAGFLGLGGLSLEQLLRARAQAHAAGKPTLDTACILFWLGGGPSHLETYDLKPEVPEAYRSAFRPVPTKTPGMDVCELLPRHTQVADKFAVIRSMSHGCGNHEDGAQQVLTGRLPLKRGNPVPDYPDLGSVFSRMRQPLRQVLPNYVALGHSRPDANGAAYLGPAYEPFILRANANSPDFQVPDLTLPTAEAVARLSHRGELLRDFDRFHRHVDLHGHLDAMDRFQQQAMQILTGGQARWAFDVDREDPRLRDRYGRTFTGQTLLLARRLVEAGVGFVTVRIDRENDDKMIASNWDDHASNGHIFYAMQRRLPIYDQAVAALIEDLYERGLERRVLLVVMGEFGRTPLLEKQADGRPGRGHWPSAMSILVSGGGMRMGQAIGSTTPKGEHPKDRPLHPTDLLATVYRFLGIDPKQEFAGFSGRPLAILPDGEPIRELLG